MLASSSLSLNDFGEPDLGVLGIAESGCGLIFSGVSGWLRLTELDIEPLRRLLRTGDSAERSDMGEPAADARVAE